MVSTLTLPEIGVDGGVHRQVLADHGALMFVAFRFNAGMEGAPHHHRHVQATVVRSGRFEFRQNGKTFTINAGDSVVIPSNALHGCVCLEDGDLIDCFTPRRDDFL